MTESRGKLIPFERPALRAERELTPLAKEPTVLEDVYTELLGISKDDDFEPDEEDLIEAGYIVEDVKHEE